MGKIIIFKLVISCEFSNVSPGHKDQLLPIVAKSLCDLLYVMNKVQNVEASGSENKFCENKPDDQIWTLTTTYCNIL